MIDNVVVRHELSLLTVVRTLKTYARHPIQSWQRERREWGKYLAGLKLDRLGIAEYFVDGKLDSGAIPPDFADLLNIYELVRARKPKVVVELGSGCSTPVFARALAENTSEGSGGHLHSFEASAHWIECTRALLPDEFRQFVTLHEATQEVVEVDGEKVRRCNGLDGLAVNFLYVDGIGHLPGIPIGAEAYFIEEGAPEDFFVLVDGRGPTVDFLRRRLRRNYQTRTNQVQKWTTFEPL